MSLPSIADIEHALLPFRIGRRLVLAKLVERIAQGEGLGDPFLLLSWLFGRLKSADSILEKAQRKGIALASVAEIPEKIRDVLGFRIIVEHSTELQVLDSFLSHQFEVIHRSDQSAEPGEFGQLGIDYSLRYHAGGAVYPFELQLRTFLQHYWTGQSFHLFHKKPRELALEHKRTLLELSQTLQRAEQPASRLATTVPTAQATTPAWRRLPLCREIRLIVVETGERFAAQFVLPISGNDLAEHETIVARKLELYETHRGAAIVECCCLNISSLLLNEPHLYVPGEHMERAVF